VESTWHSEDKVREYVSRVGRLEARRQGEAELVEYLPTHVDRALDLGCGDGRLLELVLNTHHETAEAIGLDDSPPMLELAQQRLGHDPRVSIVSHDLSEPLPELGQFDVIVSGFAIHHLEHERKRRLFAEIADALTPGGRFINLEVVQCATPLLHELFNERIGRVGGDPEDIRAGAGEQLEWMRDAGLIEVDCAWRWRGFAVLIGSAPPPTSPRANASTPSA